MQSLSSAAIAVARLVGASRKRERRDQTSIAATRARRRPSAQITSAIVESSSQSALRPEAAAAASPKAGCRYERCRSGLVTALSSAAWSARQRESQRWMLRIWGAAPWRAISVSSTSVAVRCRPRS